VVSLLPLAALGEIVTYRRVFLCGLTVFTCASLACALSPSLPVLGLARTLQGFGAAGVMSVNGALLRFTLPADRLGRGVGLNALVVSAAAVAGPTIASALLSVGPWPLLFWVNAPLGVAAVLMALKGLPDSPRANKGLDWLSAGLNIMAFGLFFTGVDVLTRERLPLAGGLEIAFGVLAGALLVRRSMDQARPLLPIDLMQRPIFALSVLTSVASFAGQMLAFVALPFFFQEGLGRSQVATGLLITPWPLAVGAAAPLAGRLADRFPAAILSFLGLIAFAVGLLLLAAMTKATQEPDLLARMALCGLGFGFFQAPNNRTLLSSAPMERAGAAGGVLATARLTGQTVGATSAAVLFALGAGGPRRALVLAAAFAGAAALVSLTRLGAGPGRA
jgi:DHA2 family multidrug resistance protein-like MFS transporter